MPRGERERREERKHRDAIIIAYPHIYMHSHMHTHSQIEIHESVPVQVDGEPWQQGPATITISHHGQAHMLKKIKHD